MLSLNEEHVPSRQVRECQGTASCFRVKDWLDGPWCNNRVNCGHRPPPPTCQRSIASHPSRFFPHGRTKQQAERSLSLDRTTVLLFAFVSLVRAAALSSMQRRCCSMKWNMFFGALVVSVGLCSQSFGFELLDRMLGVSRSSCGGCCESSCCEQSCCAEKSCCEQPSCCEKKCEPACCEKSCCEQESCCDPCNSCCKKKCDLFGGLKGMFDCGGCCKKSCCEASCCDAAPTCCEKPSCCEKQSCCEKKSCCEEPSCCDSCNSCCKKKCCGGLFSGLFKKKCCKKSCCNTCDSCNSCNSCGGGGAGHTDAPAAEGTAAPMPPAPMADPSASIQGKRRVVQASNAVARRN